VKLKIIAEHVILSVINAMCHMKAIYAEFYYDECRRTECRYADCHGTSGQTLKKIFSEWPSIPIRKSHVEIVKSNLGQFCPQFSNWCQRNL
jgi:hypothetical protein